jgi:hypothetical protein
LLKLGNTLIAVIAAPSIPDISVFGSSVTGVALISSGNVDSAGTSVAFAGAVGAFPSRPRPGIPEYAGSVVLVADVF